MHESRTWLGIVDLFLSSVQPCVEVNVEPVAAQVLLGDGNRWHPAPLELLPDLLLPPFLVHEAAVVVLRFVVALVFSLQHQIFEVARQFVA